MDIIQQIPLKVDGCRKHECLSDWFRIVKTAYIQSGRGHCKIDVTDIITEKMDIDYAIGYVNETRVLTYEQDDNSLHSIHGQKYLTNRGVYYRQENRRFGGGLIGNMFGSNATVYYDPEDSSSFIYTDHKTETIYSLKADDNRIYFVSESKYPQKQDLPVCLPAVIAMPFLLLGVWYANMI